MGALAQSDSTPFSLRDLKRFAFVIFVFAFALRLVMAWKAGFFSNFKPNYQTEMVRIALSLVKDHEYGNPFVTHTGPTAHEMPLYPLFLAVLYRIFGPGALAEAVKIALACAVSALRCALLVVFCAETLGHKIAVTAGILSCVYIAALETELRGNWDTPWQAMVLLLLTWGTVSLWQEQSWVRRTPWPYFMLWGAAILLQPAFLPVLAAFMLAGFMACQKELRGAFLKRCLLWIAVIVVFLSPWTVRNYFQLGKLVLTRDNFGLEFWQSYGPGRAFDMATDMGPTVPHPSSNRLESQQVLRLGEVKYNQTKLMEAEAWVRTNPRESVRLTVFRFLAFWLPLGRNATHSVINFSISLLAFAGLALLFRRHRLIAILFALAWLSYPLVYYVVRYSPRYRYPLTWQLMVCASISLNSILNFVMDLLQNGGHRASQTV
jgi:hypothetical protein